ncbi:MAG: hypothetical protein QOH24_477 [Verrucomicrobiota bacterium]|jgi:hypothetical protein
MRGDITQSELCAQLAWAGSLAVFAARDDTRHWARVLLYANELCVEIAA